MSLSLSKDTYTRETVLGAIKDLGGVPLKTCEEPEIGKQVLITLRPKPSAPTQIVGFHLISSHLISLHHHRR